MRTDITLASWVSASLGNNYATPTLLDAIGSPLALNVLEQASMVAVALLVLQARRSALVNVAALKRSGGLTVLGMGMCNALTCRLFMLSLHHLPLSLCHTIRAASPCCAAIIRLASGRPIARQQLLALPMIVAGFALAVSAQPSCSAVGVSAAIGSMLALSGLQHLTKRLLDDGSHDMQVQLMQCSMSCAALASLLPLAQARSLGALLSRGIRFRLLWALNTVSDYVENVAATAACGDFDPLTFSVLDTVRRLGVILVCGFVARKNPAGPANVAGMLLVFAGALVYSHISHGMDIHIGSSS